MNNRARVEVRGMKVCPSILPQIYVRVATVREKYLENEIFSRSGKSQGILWMVREIRKYLESQGIWK